MSERDLAKATLSIQPEGIPKPVMTRLKVTNLKHGIGKGAAAYEGGGGGGGGASASLGGAGGRGAAAESDVPFPYPCCW